MNELILAENVSLVPYENNSRTHSEAQIAQLAKSIEEFGFYGDIVHRDGIIAMGHARVEAIKLLLSQGKDIYPIPGKASGAKPFTKANPIPTKNAAGWSDAQFRAVVIADNKLALNAGWDFDLVRIELDSLKIDNFDLDTIGFDASELVDIFANLNDSYPGATMKNVMRREYGVPPFTVLNAREGSWQARKQEWIALGIKSEEGRAEKLIGYSEKATIGKDTSIFDPVLCEIAYSWFAPARGKILDPFAGGSVRGIVASKLGLKYTGIDLSSRQVAANKEQAKPITKFKPEWKAGDSRDMKSILPKSFLADMMLSCPPYHDLEQYSKDPNDLSNMDYAEFIAAYRVIIAASFDYLKEDSFAVWVVGEIRDKRGNYRNFVGDTISAFLDAGFKYYNEAILVTAVGSLPIRAGKMMKASRKLGKAHQNVLVFVKGSGKKAAKRCGDIEIMEEVMPTDTSADPAEKYGEIL